jgi:outer membrane protein assembly factor BamD (BamD/ComL family)
MRIKSILTLLAMTILAGCTSGDKKAAELLDTAVFEEKQNNFEHAAKLYDEIIRKHPESQAAQEARAHMEKFNTRKP